MTAANYDSISFFDDVESINTYREFCEIMPEEEALAKINFGSRDNARHPMAWDSSKNGGFTTGEPWIALHSRWQEINLERDLAGEHSVYRFYQALLKLRRSEEAFITGELQIISSPEDPYFIFTRSESGKQWVVVCNFETKQEISLPFACEAPVLSNLDRTEINGTYSPYECAAALVKDAC